MELELDPLSGPRRLMDALILPYAPLEVTRQPPKVERADLGSSVDIAVSAEGHPAPVPQWFFLPDGGDGDTDFVHLPECDGEWMVPIDDLSPEDCGYYKCIVSKNPALRSRASTYSFHVFRFPTESPCMMWTTRGVRRRR